MGVAGVSWLGFASTVAYAADSQAPQFRRGCEDVFRFPGLVYRGTTPTMTLEDLAAYAAPVFWLSPDEPTLRRQRGPAMRVPAAMPFETPADSPVIYYEVTHVAQLPNLAEPGLQIDKTDKARSTLDLASVSAVRIKYIAYFPEETGVGQHLPDVEPTEVRVVITRANGPLMRRVGYDCDASDFLVLVRRVTGEAHGNPWYYNVLDVDDETVLPIHVLVEEGKHGTATDRNADGYFTPGYDVSIRTNDAWGVRDTIRGGRLFSGAFEAWMAKVRRPEHRVLPPLPADSPLHARLVETGATSAENAVYALRPYPTAAQAGGDTLLEEKIREKEVLNWPLVETSADPFSPIVEALNEGRELRPFSVALRADDGPGPGLAVAFPLLLIKNVQEPLAGGYIVNRMYFRDENFRDWGWMAMYTPSASRWFDQYFAAGMETDRGDEDEAGRQLVTRSFVLETGFKFRFRAPNRAFGLLTDFWGFRFGVKNLGAVQIDHLSYVFEVGAGAW
jgi:hypothetical protein